MGEIMTQSEPFPGEAVPQGEGKSGRKKIIVIAILCIIIVIGVIAFFFIESKKPATILTHAGTTIQNGTYPKVASGIVPSRAILRPVGVAVKKKIQPPAWKSYVNRTYVYGIMYPADWTVTEDATKDAEFIPPGTARLAKDNVPTPAITTRILQTPFNKPDISKQVDTTVVPVQISSSLYGYYYTDGGVWYFVAPLNNQTNTLEFTLHSLSSKTITNLSRTFGTSVRNADLNTFKTMVSTFEEP